MKTREKDLLRIIALAIDIFIAGSMVFFLAISFRILFPNVEYNHTEITFSMSLSVCYFVFFDIFNNGQSIGKALLGIESSKNKVLTERITRSILKSFSLYIFPITLLFYLIKGKILHDYLLQSHNLKFG
jgi:hypothetical protein